jgi:hypothetical protein
LARTSVSAGHLLTEATRKTIAVAFLPRPSEIAASLVKTRGYRKRPLTDLKNLLALKQLEVSRLRRTGVDRPPLTGAAELPRYSDQVRSDAIIEHAQVKGCSLGDRLKLSGPLTSAPFGFSRAISNGSSGLDSTTIPLRGVSSLPSVWKTNRVSRRGFT